MPCLSPALNTHSATTMPLSFLNLPTLPDDALQCAPDTAITLKTATTAPTLLPVDCHYDTSRLTRCFMRPHVALGGGGVAGGGAHPSNMGGMAHAGEDGVGFDHDVDQGVDHDDDYGGGFEAWGNDDGGMGEGGLQLVAAPARTGKVQVTYARRSKQVCWEDALFPVVDVCVCE